MKWHEIQSAAQQQSIRRIRKAGFIALAGKGYEVLACGVDRRIFSWNPSNKKAIIYIPKAHKVTLEKGQGLVHLISLALRTIRDEEDGNRVEMALTHSSIVSGYSMSQKPHWQYALSSVARHQQIITGAMADENIDFQWLRISYGPEISRVEQNPCLLFYYDALKMSHFSCLEIPEILEGFQNAGSSPSRLPIRREEKSQNRSRRGRNR